MATPQGPCSKIGNRPRSNLYNNKKLRIDCFDESRVNSWEKIYFISAGSFVKIGKSFNPCERLKQLQTAHYEKLQLLDALIFPYEAPCVERFLHRYFAKLRSDGSREWFRVENKLKFLIQQKNKRRVILNAIKDNPCLYPTSSCRNIEHLFEPLSQQILRHRWKENPTEVNDDLLEDAMSFLKYEINCIEP